MKDYLGLTMTEREIGAVSSLGLAHLGDCVYELMVRSLLFGAVFMFDSGEFTFSEEALEDIRYIIDREFQIP